MASLSRALAAAAVLAAGCAAPTWAQTLTLQQQRMNYCNVVASSQGLQGDWRKSYLTACMNGQNPTPATANKPLTVQQQREIDCDAQANTQRLGGEARRTFMKSCLRM
ncbi:PsiF family protein [Bordetella sp. FB-8]|uniref:PsiF family protein n=1 Tax=Bordetella sp. FB-8 TaxID=1159870 RepID=UPI0003612973|nr:PsiF family protein [Bordetella sp. FB-8]